MTSVKSSEMVKLILEREKRSSFLLFPPTSHLPKSYEQHYVDSKKFKTVWTDSAKLFPEWYNITVYEPRKECQKLSNTMNSPT